MEKFTFTNRKRQTGKENRRTIKIYSQTADTIEADILEVDGNVIEPGKAIDADVMNRFQDTIVLAEENSVTAKSTSETARSVAQTADTNANAALTNSQTAIDIANTAKATADEALQQVVEKQGTKVYVAGEYVSTFDADTKLDKSVYEADKVTYETNNQNLNTSLNGVSSRTTTLENKPVITKISYDSTTDTFTF